MICRMRPVRSAGAGSCAKPAVVAKSRASAQNPVRKHKPVRSETLTIAFLREFVPSHRAFCCARKGSERGHSFENKNGELTARRRSSVGKNFLDGVGNLVGVRQQLADLPELYFRELRFETWHAAQADAVRSFPVGFPRWVVGDTRPVKQLRRPGKEALGDVGPGPIRQAVTHGAI